MSAALKNCTATVKLNTGANIPAIGLGTWRSENNDGYDSVIAAAKVGYRHIDTAAIYGNEDQVGKAINECGVTRSELFVTTKLWGTQQRDPETALNQSLKRLGLDYVDLYLIHWPVAFKTDTIKDGNLLTIPKKDGEADIDYPEWNFIKTWELMQNLLKTGKTKAIGISNFSINNIKELLAAPTTTVTPACNQVEVHPLLPQDELIAFCKEKGIVIEAYSPLGGINAPVLKDETIIEIAKRNNVDAGQVVTSWHVQRGYVVLPKSVKESRIISNLKTFTLSDDDMTKINNLVKVKGENRTCDLGIKGFPMFQ
ncbi:hypothetical protein TBLA_0A02825 [Henningerozyma blattae CBS 6284]|uniref:NADP-dependent oxidoreductase domain-containing protein n=1 Tax=Henningerozyma blattae (strain ATCC 34711 / CBS 6284 / DSM 70876 / NBRC 10599 / NRRL Y-10934 / UCD 77-7) TaxID=1071380 RepID=I2GVC9_HENB6|nr:hypothetical protein TBLA_0A02825 [Tetrapisispora blattae CBS 6284]CCH58081.1 hypothetical protein TBLA_0A02825 [Tetrapisispora blattae CBS 6284]